MSYDPELFNADPYYDDFSESKKFLRVMFKPGYALLAREVTQLQTILQNQIERFGNHIFEDGYKWGEDYSFCIRWRKIGGQVWVDPEIEMGHVGYKIFQGNLGNYLRNR